MSLSIDFEKHVAESSEETCWKCLKEAQKVDDKLERRLAMTPFPLLLSSADRLCDEMGVDKRFMPFFDKAFRGLKRDFGIEVEP